MCEARSARGARRGGASWGDPRHDHGGPRFGPRVLGCIAFSPWVEARGTCKQLLHEGRTWPARRRALGSKRGTVAAQTALGCASGDTSSKVQREWGRKDDSTNRGSMVESALAWCREHTTVRKGFAASRSQLASTSPRRRPGAAPSNGSRRAVDEAPLSPTSFSPLELPHSFPSPLIVVADREGAKPQCDLACGRGLAPGL
jgi:hypothetical protein